MKRILAASLAVLLVGCGVGYRTSTSEVSYAGWDEGNGRWSFVIAGADPASFQELGGGYARDAKRVYRNGLVIEHADAATFRRIGGSYWRDRQRVFLNGTVVRQADPATFRILEPGMNWGRDARDVYFGTTPVGVVDLATFEIVRDHWARDSVHYYSDIGPTNFYKVICDRATFVIINRAYAKDKDRAYWGGKPIEDADVATFESAGKYGAKDAKGLFSGAMRYGR